MRRATLVIKVYSEAGQIGWLDSNYSGLSATLRTAYENLVREDVVNQAVEELGGSIEDAAADLATSPGTAQRLRNLLVLPSSEEEHE